MYRVLATLINRFDNLLALDTNVIPWGCPVPSFGDPAISRVATVGLNPSNREFVDAQGNELHEGIRRLHTLRSLGLEAWHDADASHLGLILDSCRTYFLSNPYDGWFKRLDVLLHGLGVSFYSLATGACHLDLIPYATALKWTELTSKQRRTLREASADSLGLLLRESTIEVVILNGSAVVRALGEITDMELKKSSMPDWDLPRPNGESVMGWGVKGTIDHVAGVALGRDVLVLGYNHNLQSKFKLLN